MDWERLCGSNPSLWIAALYFNWYKPSMPKNKTINWPFIEKYAAFPQSFLFFPCWFFGSKKKEHGFCPPNLLGSSQRFQARIPRVESSHHLAQFVDLGSNPWDVHVTQDPKRTNGPQRTNGPIPEIFRQLRQMFLDQMVEKGVGRRNSNI